MRAIAKAFETIDGAHAYELKAIYRSHAGTLSEHPAYEVGVFLQHAGEAEIIGVRVAVELCAGDVAFLDAQRIERVEAVWGDAVGFACFQKRSPYRRCVACGDCDLIRAFAGEGDSE